jgi:hypothetical protein
MRTWSSPNEEPPTSTRRLFLARAFAHCCALHCGCRPHDVVAALDPDSDASPKDRREVGFAGRLLGELAASKGIEPSPVHSAAVLRRRYLREPGNVTTSAPSSGSARSIRSSRSTPPPLRRTGFLDQEDFNRIVEMNCADVVPPSRVMAVAQDVAPEEYPARRKATSLS